MSFRAQSRTIAKFISSFINCSGRSREISAFQVVIKNLGEKFKNLIGIAGATEIGEEHPILILDPAGLATIATAGRLRLVH